MVRRALQDVGANPAAATFDDYCRAVPRLEARLRCFLSAPEAAQRAQSVVAIGMARVDDDLRPDEGVGR
jgi:hypothetical protein